MANYGTLPGFEGLFLEDSWILALEPGDTTFTFVVEFVVRESHPRYRAPRPGEQYCYRRGRIRFAEVSTLSWTSRPSPSPHDAFGEQDLGSFDEFDAVGDAYRISGDFGRVELVSPPPSVELFD